MRPLSARYPQHAGAAVDPTGNPVRALIVRTTPRGSAAEAGMVPGGFLTAINNQKVASLADLQAALARIAPGTASTTTVTNQTGDVNAVTVTTCQLGG